MSVENVLITGASSGIGLELARCFAADGSRLILVSRKRNALQELADELRQAHKTQSEVLPFDLGEPEAPARLFHHLETKGTRVDVLVNNAGFGANGPFVKLPVDLQRNMVQVNALAPMLLTRLLLPRMLEKKRGGVLNVASTAAFQPGPLMAVYFATKAFLLSFSEALAEEVAGSGLTITALCPGPTATNFAAASNAQHSRLFERTAMSAKAVAVAGHRAFRAGKPLVVTGMRNRLLIWSVRLAPRTVVRKIAKRFNKASYKTTSVKG